MKLPFSSDKRPKKILSQSLALYNQAKKKESSAYAGEFEHLDKIVNEFKISDGYIVDIAAGDGYTQSCTLGFFKRGWKGLCVEMDPVKFAYLSFLYHQFPKVNLLRNVVTPRNAHLVLESNNVPKDFDLLNLDIDSYDLEVMKKILEANFTPKVISMEINEKIPPPIYFSVKFDKNYTWRGDHFYGCSITAAADLLIKNGYIVNSLQYNNLIVLSSDTKIFYLYLNTNNLSKILIFVFIFSFYAHI